jgi:hypothetical protein
MKLVRNGVIYKMEKIDKILNKMNNRNKIKNAKLIEAENDFKLIDQNRKINKLRQESKNDFWIQFKGYAIMLYAIIGTIATTSLSIAGGVAFFEKPFIFGLAMFSVQAGLFLLTMNETTIKNNFPNHYFIVKLLQLGLLILSIKFNYVFFSHSHRLELSTLLLCICFDITILKSISISADFRNLNFHKKNNDFDFENMSFLKMIWFNFTAKYRMNTLRSFNYNKAQFNKIKAENQEINARSKLPLEKDSDDLKKLTGDKGLILEQKEPSKLLFYNDYKNQKDEKPINSEKKEVLEHKSIVIERDRTTLLKAIFENKSKDNICPSISKLENITGLSKDKISKIKKELINDGILTTKGTKTIINVDDLSKLKS